MAVGLPFPPDVLTHLGVAALAGVTSFALSLLLTPFVRIMAVRLGCVSKPLEDRWGKRVIARLGGLALFASALAAALIWIPREQFLARFIVVLALAVALGLFDDIHRIRPYTKLVAQLLIGCVMVVAGFRLEIIRWTWVSIPLSVLWFVLIMNAFNLLDNMDGLAAGIGAIASGVCGVHAAVAGLWPLVGLNAILCGACVGFLRYNFPPAKIYMGDAGSHFLGLSLAALSLSGTWYHSAQLASILAVPVLVLAVPIFDTCFVTIQRLLNRQHPFVGGTDHVSHRLAVLGLTTRQTVGVLYGISGLLGLLSVLLVQLRFVHLLILGFMVLAGLLLFGSYLAKVKVYHAVQPSGMPGVPPPGASVTWIETMLLHKRRILEVMLDFCLLSSAHVLAYLLRFEGTLTGDLQARIIQSLPVILVVKLACFAACGLYRGVWRYVGLSDLLVLVRAVVFSSLFSACVMLYLWRFEGYSRAVFVIDGMLTFFAVGGARVAERLLDEWIGRLTTRGIPVVILGAGDTGARVLELLKHEQKNARRVVGFLDDDLHKLRSRIHGCSVLGTRALLGDVLDIYGVREVLVAVNDPPGELLQHVQRCCEPREVLWKVVTAGVTDVR